VTRLSRRRFIRSARWIRSRASCEDGNCPQIDQLSDGNFEIQGYTIAAADKPDLPAGHDRVWIPRDTLLLLVTQLQNPSAQQGA
jgi:hypothetical protein